MTDKFQGKWLNVSEGRPFGYPYFIEFENGIIKHSLLKEISEDLLIPESKEDKFNENISSIIKLETLSPNRIRIFRKGIKHTVVNDKETKTEDAIFEDDYVKLLPTKSFLSESRIQLMKYDLNWNDEKLTIEFNKILDKPYIQEMNKRLNREGMKILLEKLDETLIVSILNDNERGLVTPIKVVDEEKMILYGFPIEPYEVIANRIK